MATILPFPRAKVSSASGLTTGECEALHAKAFVLIKQGLATRVSVHDNGQYICVFDCRGEPFFFGRVDGVYYLFGQNETLIAKAERFEVLMETLVEQLTPKPEIPT